MISISPPEYWKLYAIGGRWPHWQVATPYGPWNFVANDQAAAQKLVDVERERYERGVVPATQCSCGKCESSRRL